MGDGWLDAIEPGALVGVAWGGECRAAELLAVQSIWADFGVVLALWQRVGQRLALQLVACCTKAGVTSISPTPQMACAGACGMVHASRTESRQVLQLLALHR